MLKYLTQVKTYFSSGVRAFLRIRGTYKAAAFAYYGLFSLFPLIALVISVSSFFVDKESINTTLSMLINLFFPMSLSLETTIEHAVESFISYRDKTGFAAFLLLIWGSLKFFNILLTSINSAWGIHENTWWVKSLKNLLLITLVNILFFLSLAIPTIIQSIKRLSSYINNPFLSYSKVMTLFWELAPFSVMLAGITLLYYMTPQMRNIKLKHVWKESLFVTLTLKIIQDTFSYFTANFSNINLFYGTLGEIIGLLLWIHIVGILIIFGACLSASNYFSYPPKHYL